MSELEYKVNVQHHKYPEQQTVLAWGLATPDEAYQLAWGWYSLTGKTAQISSNMWVCHAADANC